MTRHRGALVGAALWLAPALPLAAQSTLPALTIAYVERDGDAAYGMQRFYAGIHNRESKPPVAGAELGIQDGKALVRAIGREFVLRRVRLAADDDAAPKIRAAAEESGAIAALLDLPLDDVRRVAAQLMGDGIAMFNIRHRDSALRESSCGTGLFHVLPSQAMLADALAQYLHFKAWRRVLVLEGVADDDRAISQAFQDSARKFQLRIVGIKSFVLGNDPRRRDQISVPLLTGDTEHDVVFVAEASGEFARYVPYRTAKPRPIVGSEGLMAAAWNPAWERHGAPQLNRRFERMAGRAMRDEDWAAWAAVRAVAQAAAQSRAASRVEFARALKRPELGLELYKGTAGSFRPWDLQLRQPILLHTHAVVVERAPIEGFLHQRSELDTLGVDGPESKCRQ